MSLLIPPRHVGPELIDLPGHDVQVVEESLRDIQWVNRRLSGWRVLARLLPRLTASVPRGRPLRVLDLGTGSADLPRRLVGWGRARGIDVRVVAVDRSPEVLAFARREVGDGAGVQLIRADAFRLPFRPRQFDLVTCSLFLHHFDPEDAVALLAAMAAMARGAILVNDLQRHRMAYWGIWLISRTWRRGELFRNDAPLSVLRAYRPAELRDLLRRAGLPGLHVTRFFPFRMAAHGAAPPAAAARRAARTALPDGPRAGGANSAVAAPETR